MLTQCYFAHIASHRVIGGKMGLTLFVSVDEYFLNVFSSHSEFSRGNISELYELELD